MSIKPFKFDDVFIGRTPDRARVFVEAEWDGTRLSLTGTVIDHGEREPVSVGQVTDEVRSVHPRLADLWERWHLNDMIAGCKHQEQGYRDGIAGRPTYANNYAGMSEPCPECGYRYGSAWNTEDVPDAVLAEIHSILSDPMAGR